MSFSYEIRCLNIASVLELYHRRYDDALRLTPTDEQNNASESSPQTGIVYQNPVERSASKHFGLMMLEVLFELSKSSTKEIQDAFAEVIVFCRFRENIISPYSAVQSILVPGLFYIELGQFLKIDFHVEGAQYQSNPLNHLGALILSGFVPLLQKDLKNAERIRFCPGGFLTEQLDQSEYCYQLNPHKPSLLTQDVLKKLFELLVQKENEYLLNCNVDNRSGINNTTIDLIMRRSDFFKHELNALIEMTTLFANERNDVFQRAPGQVRHALTGLNRANTAQDSSDSDDDFQRLPAHELNFFTQLPRRDTAIAERQTEDEMGPHERFKFGIE